jgi:multidrug resistance efflux pump
MIWGSGLVGMLGVGAVLGVLEFAPQGTRHVAEAGTGHEAEKAQEQRMQVETIRPKQDPKFVIAVQQLAAVEPYFQAELRSRVAGPVKYIHRNIGDVVHKGDLLVEIDVPDQREEVAQKDEVIRQRLKELKLSQAQVRFARAAVEVAERNVDQKKAELERDKENYDFHKMRFDRFRRLQEQNSIEQNKVDEQEKDYLAAEAAYESSEIGVPKAKADLAEKQANLEADLADEEVKLSLVEVARKDRDKAQALANYAKIYADFDGVITERTVDPGDFVQNSATAHTEPLLSIARTDVVTVVTKIPDNDAPFVGRNTEAVALLDNLPDTEIRGKVSRFSPKIRSEDRTMRVEVDLFNGTEAQYQRYVLKTLATLLAPVGVTHAGEATALFAAGRHLWRQNAKGEGDVFPVLPKVAGVGLEGRHLLPGMSGYLRLLLRKFQHAYLVPSTAVFSRGGKTYIAEVKDGVVHLVPVHVQVTDGKMAKIVVVASPDHPLLGEKEVFRDLTGGEDIVIARQSELSDGQEVSAERLTADKAKELKLDLPPAWQPGAAATASK